MEHNKHERFLSANQQLRIFLRQVAGAANGTRKISASDLQAISQRLIIGAASIGDASRDETLDADLRNGIADYVDNLRALQTTIQKMRALSGQRSKKKR